jgi:Beta-galactosidase trimerisation domain
MQVHWLLDNVQNAREWMLHSGGDRHSHFTGLRNSWTKLIEDLGLQYEFVGRGAIEEGKLGTGQYRVFIMPQSLALSAGEANAIRQFVHAGGLVIADYRAASMNEHGRDLGEGQLNDVFGIHRVQGQKRGQTAEGGTADDLLHLRGKQLHVVAGDETVGIGSGKALAQSGSVPLLIVNDFGRGKAVFLNLEISSYAYDRLQPHSATSLPDLLEGVFGFAQIEPRVRVTDADGKRLPGTEIVRFANGPFEHVAIFRNPQFDDGGWGDYPTEKAGEWAGQISNTLLEEPAQVTVSWPGPMHTYDIRGRKDLGEAAKYEAVLQPWGPLTFTRAAQAVPKYLLDAPEQVEAGTPLTITLRDEGSLPEAAFRVLRLEFFTPAGQPYELYAQNVLVKSTPHNVMVPLAHNDPPGRWVLKTRDVMTGQLLERAFTVRS